MNGHCQGQGCGGASTETVCNLGPTVEAKSPKTGSWGKYSVGHWDPFSDGRGSRANKNIM